jgi:hypothetical protein
MQNDEELIPVRRFAITSTGDHMTTNLPLTCSMQVLPDLVFPD